MTTPLTGSRAGGVDFSPLISPASGSMEIALWIGAQIRRDAAMPKPDEILRKSGTWIGNPQDDRNWLEKLGDRIENRLQGNIWGAVFLAAIAFWIVMLVCLVAVMIL